MVTKPEGLSRLLDLSSGSPSAGDRTQSVQRVCERFVCERFVWFNTSPGGVGPRTWTPAGWPSSASPADVCWLPPVRARTRPRRSLRCALTSLMNSFSGTGANTGGGGGWLPLAAILSCQLTEHLADGVVEGMQCADHLLLRDVQCPS